MKEGYYIDIDGIKTIILSRTKELFVSNKNLVELVCNRELKVLLCKHNKLTKLTLNDKLEQLYCYNNVKLIELKLNDNLRWLYCDLNTYRFAYKSRFFNGFYTLLALVALRGLTELKTK